MAQKRTRIRFSLEERAFLITNYLRGVKDIDNLIELFLATHVGRPRPANLTVKKLIVKFFQTKSIHSKDCKIYAIDLSKPESPIARPGSVANWLFKDDEDPQDRKKILQNSCIVTQDKEQKFQKAYNQNQNWVRQPRKVKNLYVIERKAEFCYNMRRTIQEDPSVLSNICFSDVFTIVLTVNPATGQILYHDMWPKQDSKRTAKIFNPRYQFAIDVWVGILGNEIIGPIIFKDEFSPATYLEMMEFLVVPTIKHYRGNDRVWFLQENSPPGSAEAVQNLLRHEFGTNNPLGLPSFCRDVNPLAFFYWPYLRGQMLQRNFRTFDELKCAMFEITESIPIEWFVKANKEFKNRLETTVVKFPCNTFYF